VSTKLPLITTESFEFGNNLSRLVTDRNENSYELVSFIFLATAISGVTIVCKFTVDLVPSLVSDFLGVKSSLTSISDLVPLIPSAPCNWLINCNSSATDEPFILEPSSIFQLLNFLFNVFNSLVSASVRPVLFLFE